ncbi:type I restriction endonuclease subunit R [Lactobacillus sp. ESL0701]|uniref:type I restriction endonuclease subunit R n=1 Tax=Lactobacillus sp. ESL0701 TaxID=2983217 RepID=UPI0023F6C38F|nr:type I restriction endonuclease subunit R [Lactobacillus sp. ESL0701]MDF7673086.1 type I restriction endonuclease subunit R [Lactobacillus sp. ESL0701]
MTESHLKYKVKVPVAELPNQIILAEFKPREHVQKSYQTEAELEENLLIRLQAQGYEFLSASSSADLYVNLKKQIEKLNKVEFTSKEWQRFLNEYLDKPNDGMIEKTRKVQIDSVKDFIFDDGHLKNIKIIDKKCLSNNYVQVVHQISQTGTHHNRYDVTILVNGLPLVHIELKKRGVNLHEAFNQIHRYSKESFNSDNSLYKYVQLFVISNGTYTRYFANTTAQDKNHYEFTCEWADVKNRPIRDLEDFTATFFDKTTLLEIITKYCVFNSDNKLLVMRPYQIAATERILWKIRSSYLSGKAGTIDAGGYIWHTTGSGKTLTSFKVARLVTQLDYIAKVFFVVDRKDLDYQTMKEYQSFEKDSVNGSKNTKALKQNIEKEDNKIVVTTIQKLNEFVKKNPNHEIYQKHCVLIYDECHRSQFGEAQKNIRKHFKYYYQFGFTGTPIFPENAAGAETTGSIFGAQLHSYIITDAIRDKKVLKFMVDYNDSRPIFKSAEIEQDENELAKIKTKKLLLHPDRIHEITKYILKNYDLKTHRNEQYDIKSKRLNGFTAMFAVQNIEAARLYYEEFKKQQKNIPEDKRLRIATIFSFAANGEQDAVGSIADENFDPSKLNYSDKEFLDEAIKDYNNFFTPKKNYSTDGKLFQNYYQDLSKEVKNREIDLLIVVGMFLTGFDAPTLNTLFVDKNLRYHGLIQAFSRTNRILNKVKTFGNIVCFRDLQKPTEDAIKIFGDSNSVNVILERSYQDYLNGFVEEETGKVVKGYKDLCNEMIDKFPEPTKIETDSDKKEFVQLFGEILKSDNILKNYDSYQDFDQIISDRQLQDMKSTYADIREEVLEEKHNKAASDTSSKIDYSDIEFQVDLLKTDEINLDYILKLIFEKSKKNKDIGSLKVEVKRIIRSSLGIRAKEDLILGFINHTDLSKFENSSEILDSFYSFAKKQRKENVQKLIQDEHLKEGANNFIGDSIDKGYVNYNGSELDNILPPVSRRHGAREAKKQSILRKIQKIVEVFSET